MAIEIVKTINGVKQFVPLTTDSGQGLPLGAWTSFEDDKPRNGYLKAGTTFNQADYPALYNMLGTNVVPERFDHDRLGDCESITIGTSQATATEMQYDGFLVINSASTAQNLWISSDNGVSWFQVQGTGDNQGKNAVGLVKKGDLVYSPAGTDSSNFVRYYKHPMFIKAVIGPIEDSAADQVVQNINNSRSYSTEEVNTGKKWIDGKPIYKKTWYNYTIQGNSVLMTNISDIVNQYGMAKGRGDIWIPFPKDSDGLFVTLRLNASNHNAFFDSDGTYTGRFTIKYTKTTD